MKCSEFRRRWSDWQAGEYTAAEGLALSAHRTACPACRRYDHQMSLMVDALGSLPMPDASRREPARREHAHGNRPRRQFGRQALALAATLALGVAIGLVVGTTDRPIEQANEPAAVQLAGSGIHRVSLAFESPARLERVDFTVQLPDGVYMVGYPNQRRVQWEAPLAAGRSQLTLPLQVRPGSEGGTLIARIRRGDKEQTLQVPLRVEPPGADEAQASASDWG